MPAEKESLTSVRSSSISGVPSAKKLRLASALTYSDKSSIVNLPTISSREKRTRKGSKDSPN